MKPKIHVHIPYDILKKRFNDVIGARINPEIFLDSRALDSIYPRELREIYDNLSLNGLANTVHGPFMDISPGATDEEIRLVTIERFRETLHAASYLKPTRIVLHAGYDERRFDGDIGLWLRQSIKTWEDLIKRAEKINTVLALENVYEENPYPIKKLLESIDSPCLGFCLDIGHLNVYSRARMDEWFSELGKRIIETHIHDNHGEKDEHLAINEGNIDFELFFSLLKKYSDNRVYTIEPHDEEAVFKALKTIKGIL